MNVSTSGIRNSVGNVNSQTMPPLPVVPSREYNYSIPPSVADSADWSVYSDTFPSETNRHGEQNYPQAPSSPDPFDTSNIVTTPTITNNINSSTNQSSRYYSFVPTSPPTSPNALPSNQPAVASNDIQTVQTVSTPLTYQVKNPTPDEPQKIPMIKAPPELLKKRDEAFSWLDQTMDTLSIGKESPQPEARHTNETGSGTRPLSSGSNSSGSNNGSWNAQTLNNMTASSNNWTSASAAAARKLLDSGDEVWNNLGKWTNQEKESTEQKETKASPFSIPPPPANSRISVGNGGNRRTIGGNNTASSLFYNGDIFSSHSNGGTIPPPYRSPPAPMGGIGMLSNGHESRVHNAAQGFLNAIRLLREKVPAASTEEIGLVLKETRGDVGIAERRLKIEQLSK